MAQLGCKSGSWKPFFLSVFADVVSKVYAKTFAPMSNGTEEMNRRALKYLLYLFRSPFFEKFTKLPLEKIGNFLNRLPLLGLLSSNLMDLLLAMQSLYFYTSAS